MVGRSRRSSTDIQRQRMKEYGLPVLPSDAMCGQVIRYVRGQEAFPDPRRLSVARRLLHAEVSVKDNHGGRETGRVIGIRLRTRDEIAAIQAKTGIKPGKVLWIVQLPHRQVQASISKIKLLTAARQKQLF